jgi:hypothetical protein
MERYKVWRERDHRATKTLFGLVDAMQSEEVSGAAAQRSLLRFAAAVTSALTSC